jgi:membrane associated rhomboid family serine protease
MSSTLILIAITCAISLVAMNKPPMIEALILWPPAISRDKQYYRLLSYGFIHGDFSHLLFNMITLFFFGRVMEQFYESVLGPFGFAIFYLLGLLASILPTYFRNRDNSRYRSLGASGAVSAVLFAFILFQPWTTIYVFVLPVPAIVYGVLYVAYTIYSERRGADNINHSAHLWGAAYGVAFTLLVEPRVFAVFLEQLAHPTLG